MSTIRYAIIPLDWQGCVLARLGPDNHKHLLSLPETLEQQITQLLEGPIREARILRVQDAQRHTIHLTLVLLEHPIQYDERQAAPATLSQLAPACQQHLRESGWGGEPTWMFLVKTFWAAPKHSAAFQDGFLSALPIGHVPHLALHEDFQSGWSTGAELVRSAHLPPNACPAT